MSERMRIIQVGCGGICGAWLNSPAYQEHVELCCLVDLSLDAAARLIDRSGLSKDTPIRSDLSAAIAEFQPEAIFDTTVPAAHHAVTTTALAAGCHVLGEKPMADTMQQASEMVAAAEAAGKVYAVTQTRRWHTRMRQLVDLVHSGVIGTPHTFNADFSIAAHFGGFREDMDHVLLLDMAIHSFDSARSLIGGVDPQWVQASEWNPPQSRYRHGANASALFGFADGSVFDYRGTWTASGAQTSWDCDWRIQGTRGSIHLVGDQPPVVERMTNPDQPAARDGGPLIRDLETVEVAWTERSGHSGHDGAIRDFIASIRDGRQPLCPAADNIKSLAMVHAAIAAAASGVRETINWRHVPLTSSPS